MANFISNKCKVEQLISEENSVSKVGRFPTATFLPTYKLAEKFHMFRYVHAYYNVTVSTPVW
jgi:hypothetical protein